MNAWRQISDLLFPTGAVRAQRNNERELLITLNSPRRRKVLCRPRPWKLNVRRYR